MWWHRPVLHLRRQRQKGQRSHNYYRKCFLGFLFVCLFGFVFFFFQFHSPTTQRLSAEIRPWNTLLSWCHTIKEQLENAAFNKFLVKDQSKFFLWKISEQARSPASRFQGDRQRAPHVVMATGLHNKSNFLKHHVQDVKLWRGSHFRSHTLSSRLPLLGQVKGFPDSREGWAAPVPTSVASQGVVTVCFLFNPGFPAKTVGVSHAFRRGLWEHPFHVSKN